MARSIEEITSNLKETFIANETVQSAYELTPGKTYDEQFSNVCIESILIFVFSASVWLLEKIWDAFRLEIEQKIDNTHVTSMPWYYQKAKEFQQGDTLYFDKQTYSYKYRVVDENKQVVKNVAIRQVTDDGVTKLKVYYSDKDKLPLSDILQQSFISYMREIAAAGTHYLFVSKEPDTIRVQLQIYYDPLILDSTGKRLDSGEKPVEKAVENYLNNLEYGGVFYSSALVDVIQQTEGVKDVVLVSTTWDGTTEARRKIESESGAFSYEKNEEDITYSIDS